MKQVLALQVILSAMVLAFFSSLSQAQTVSILTSSETPEAFLVEAAMKRNLRAEGYTVKGGTTEGFVLIFQVLPLKTQAGYRPGIVGSITIGHLQWQAFADLMVSQTCKEEHEIAQQVKEMLGTKLMLIESTVAYAGDEERLAEILSTFANAEIRKASRKMTELFETMEKYQRPEQSDVLSPVR